MPISPKNWQDTPSTSTPINAAGLTDLETRVSGYTDSVVLGSDGKIGGPGSAGLTSSVVSASSAGGATLPLQAVTGIHTALNVKDFGATGDGTTNDKPAIQAAITAAISAGGGEIYFPGGTYICASQLVADSARSITFRGQGIANGQGHQPRARIKFTLTGSGSAFSIRSNEHLYFENLGICYGSSSFTGDLLDLSHDGSGSDALTEFNHCWLYSVASTGTSDTGAPLTTAHSILKLENAINITVRGGKVGGAQWGVRGRPKDASGYSNMIVFTDNVIFDSCTSAFFCNAGQVWVIDAASFEFLDFGNGGTPYLYKSDYNGGAGGGGDLRINNCWCGDLSGSFQRFVYTSVDDSLVILTLQDNGFYGAGTSVELHGGGHALKICGNSMVPAVGTDPPIDLGDTTAGAQPYRSGYIIGNDFNGCTVEPVANRGGHGMLDIHGNLTNNSRSADTIVFSGAQLNLGDYDSCLGDTTLTLKTAAGTGASSFCSGGFPATRCQITPGTGVAAGVQAYLNLPRDFQLQIVSVDGFPKAIVFPLDDNAAAAGLFCDFATQQSFSSSGPVGRMNTIPIRAHNTPGGVMNFAVLTFI